MNSGVNNLCHDAQYINNNCNKPSNIKFIKYSWKIIESDFCYLLIIYKKCTYISVD